jgi:hypothetical protein
MVIGDGEDDEPGRAAGEAPEQGGLDQQLAEIGPAGRTEADDSMVLIAEATP